MHGLDPWLPSEDRYHGLDWKGLQTEAGQSETADFAVPPPPLKICPGLTELALTSPKMPQPIKFSCCLLSQSSGLSEIT